MESNGTRQLNRSRRQVGITGRVILCLIALSGLNACGTQSSSTPAKNVTYTNRPDDESCLYEPNIGDDESLPQSSLKESFFFGKMIDSEKIEGVYHASGQSTVSQMSAQGIDVLGVTRGSPQKCTRYSFLKTPPHEMQHLWTRIEESVSGKDKKGGEILGAFFPKGNETDGVEFRRPTVLVGVDSNRYVVAHEYMHFLYDSELATQPGYMTMQDLVGELDLLNKDLGRKNFEGKYPTLTFIQPKLTPKQNYVSLLRFLELVEKLILGYELEEVTIESKFFDDFSDDRYRWMPDGRRNSVGYIISSVLKAEKLVDSVRKFTEALIGKIQAQGTVCRMTPEHCTAEELAIAKQNETGAEPVVKKYKRLGEMTQEGRALAVSRRDRLSQIERDNRFKKASSRSHTGLVGFAGPTHSPEEASEDLQPSKHHCPRSFNPDIERVLLGK